LTSACARTFGTVAVHIPTTRMVIVDLSFIEVSRSILCSSDWLS
jgi:hypothetical protein